MGRRSLMVALLVICATSFSGCATQVELRDAGPVARKVVAMSLVEARDCVTDHWYGGLYGKSVTPYRDGYRIRNSSGHIFEFVEVQPSPEGTVISAYNGLGRLSGLSGAAFKKCALND